jgi:hypothetical protein
MEPSLWNANALLAHQPSSRKMAIFTIPNKIIAV